MRGGDETGQKSGMTEFWDWILNQVRKFAVLGMGMGLGNGMAMEPSYEMGIAGGYSMANFGGFDSSMNAGIGGGVDAGSYPPYGFQDPSVDDRMAYATHAPHFVQQAPANVSIFPGF